MRIIAGTLKGRLFAQPHGHRTHPMAEKVRGALFNVLGDISGLSVLDAFAGSGALSFEAISRGAKNVLAIDKDRSSQTAIKDSRTSLGISSDKLKIVSASASGWSDNNVEAQFDVVILAPPYDDLQDKLQASLASRHLKSGGILVLDWPGRLEPPVFDEHKLEIAKNYGDAQLVFYRKSS